MFFLYLFGIDFRIDFFIYFWWTIAPKMVRENSARRPMFATFLRPFRDPAFYIDFMLNLVTILVAFGALWLPFGSLWLTFGPLWLTFGALGLTFAHPGARFSHFWALLASFFTFLNIFDEVFTFLNIFDEILCKILLSENVHCKSDSIDQAHRIPTIFAQFSIKIQVRDRFCRILQATAGYYCRILLQDTAGYCRILRDRFCRIRSSILQ